MVEFPRALRDLVCALTGVPQAPSDWRSLVALASETLTIGVLAEAYLAENAAIEVPAEIRSLLMDVRHRTRERNRLLLGQFRELLTALNGSGVRPIVMKGLARLLGNPEEEQSRILSDIDLLIPAASRNDCVLALESLGYAVVEGAEDEFPPVLARSCDAGMVDLHTRIKPPHIGLGYEAIASHCQEVALEEGVFLMPSPTCQLLLEIVHDQLHDRDYWRGLIDVRHLIDVHRSVGQGVDWPTLASFFPAGYAKRAFRVQMLTARSLLKIDVPDIHCEGAWIRLQMLRRRVQVQFPKLRPLLTLITIAADPPRWLKGEVSAPYRSMLLRQKVVECVERYILRPHPGKI